MKSIITIFLAVFFAGCYTQVRSSGDYWGYTGHHERERVYATPDTMPQEAYQDSSYNPDGNQMDQRGRDDEGYSSGDRGLIYDDPYYYNYAGYYSAPWVSFNLGYGWGWHRPYWGLGFSSYYPYGYGWNYDPWWNWYYSPGFSPYGCLGYGGFYGGCGLYGGEYYGWHRGFYGDGFHSGFGHRFDLGAGRTGRITGGESRGRSSIIANGSGSSVQKSMGRAALAPRTTQMQSPANHRSQTTLTSPRNNPRLTPQTGRTGYARSYQGRPGSSQRAYLGGGSRGAGVSRSGGGGAYRGGGGGVSRSGGGGSRGGGRGK